jgi:hypothetical protein
MTYAFSRCGSTREDQSYATVPLAEAYHQQPRAARVPHDNLSSFFDRMVRVIEDPCKGIIEDRHRFFEADPVLPKIVRGFPCVPLEFAAHHDAAEGTTGRSFWNPWLVELTSHR